MSCSKKKIQPNKQTGLLQTMFKKQKQKMDDFFKPHIPQSNLETENVKKSRQGKKRKLVDEEKETDQTDSNQIIDVKLESNNYICLLLSF